ncbi:MAG: PhnD/SsuA/transferrin family substrate-binding protein [Pseudanabaena sp. ELA607]
MKDHFGQNNSIKHPKQLLRIGVIAVRGKEKTIEMWQPTADYLNDQLPDYRFLIVPLSFTEVHQALATDKFDFVISNASLYVEFEALYGFSRIATLKRLRLDKSYTVFGGVIFARAGRSDLSSLHDLVGKTFMGAGEYSFGGWQVAWRELQTVGINPYRDFYSLSFGGTHDSVICAVRDGLVDVGTVRSDTLELMSVEGKINLDDFQIINQQEHTEQFPFAVSTRLYPEWTFAASQQVADSLAEQVLIMLLQIGHNAPDAALAANSQGWTVPHSYESVHECLKELNVGIYANKDQSNFDLAIKGSNDGLWDWQIETDTAYYSKRWKEMLGYNDDEITNQWIEWEQRIHPEDRAYALQAINDYILGVITDHEVEHRLRHKDSSYRWILSRGKLLRDVHGKAYRMAGSHTDITHRKLAEAELRNSESRFKDKALELEQTLQELKRTQAQLIQTEKMSSLGQMVAGIAHEINNPINFVHGNLIHAYDYVSQLLNLLELYQKHYPETAPEISQSVDEIEFEYLVSDLPKLLRSMKLGTERIANIVLSLRNFSRLDEAERKAVDINEGIENTLLILQHRLKQKPGQSAITIQKFYGDLPLVECYAGQLNQVFMNIINNAIDACISAKSQPTISIKTTKLAHHVMIEIADNGSGMSAEVQKHLFDPFFTTKPVGQGTGLGLTISYQIVVEKHGGILHYESDPAKGTRFLIQIPYA